MTFCFSCHARAKALSSRGLRRWLVTLRGRGAQEGCRACQLSPVSALSKEKLQVGGLSLVVRREKGCVVVSEMRTTRIHSQSTCI